MVYDTQRWLHVTRLHLDVAHLSLPALIDGASCNNRDRCAYRKTMKIKKQFNAAQERQMLFSNTFRSCNFPPANKHRCQRTWRCTASDCVCNTWNAACKLTWGDERLISYKQEVCAEHGERSFPDYTYVVLIYRAGREGNPALQCEAQCIDLVVYHFKINRNFITFL